MASFWRVTSRSPARARCDRAGEIGKSAQRLLPVRGLRPRERPDARCAGGRERVSRLRAVVRPARVRESRPPRRLVALPVLRAGSSVCPEGFQQEGGLVGVHRGRRSERADLGAEPAGGHAHRPGTLLRARRRHTVLRLRRGAPGLPHQRRARPLRHPHAGSGRSPRPHGLRSMADERSDWKVVLQFFIVPLSLVAVLVTVFFGLQVLRSRHPDPRTALGDLKGRKRFLLPWVGDPKRWQSGYDLSLLLRSGGRADDLVPDMAAAFREAGSQGDLKLRRYLALALGRSGDRRAGAALREGLVDADGETRLYSVWGLMQIADPGALDVLRAAAADPDAGVRKMAVFALGQMADRESAPVLKGALGDTDRDVRWNAAISLARIGDASGEPLLVEMLASESPAAARTEDAVAADESSPALNAIRALALLKNDAARSALKRAAVSAG